MQSHKITTVQVLILTITLEVISASTSFHSNPWAFFTSRQARAIDGTVHDLHSGQHCVDVSTYKPVEFNDVTVKVCDSTIAKQCETKIDQTCLEVTEMNCDVQAYTDCKMTMEEVPFKSYDMVKGTYITKKCTESSEVIQHTKSAPECKDVTRQNCITKWEIDEEGNKVWAGNEDCEDVTWQECKLVERKVDFTVPKVECVDDGNPIPYMRFVNTTKAQMLNKMTCEVKSAQSCKPVVSTKCATVEYQECAEAPVEECTQREVSEPTQMKIHQEKCILTDGSVPRSDKVVDDEEEEASTEADSEAQTTTEADPVAQTTARPEENELAAGFRRGARNFIPGPSRFLTPPAEFAL